MDEGRTPPNSPPRRSKRKRRDRSPSPTSSSSGHDGSPVVKRKKTLTIDELLKILSDNPDQTSEGGTTSSGTRKRKSKRKKKTRSPSPTSSSSSDGDSTPVKKTRKISARLTTNDVLKLLAKYRGETSKSSLFSWNNLNNVVPEFDPANRTQTIESWLRKVNECSTIYGWNEKQTIHFSLQKLTGLAKRWFEALSSVVFSWSEWQSKLRRAFPSEENYGRLLEEMLSRTSRSDENLREYFYDKLGLLSRCEITGKKAVDCIIHGLTDRSIKTGAQALCCTEPEGLLNFLSSQRSQPPIQNRFHDRSGPKDPNQTGDSSSRPGTSSLVCFNCDSKGHPYHKCNRPIVKCRHCKRIGHDNENCKLQPLH